MRRRQQPAGVGRRPCDTPAAKSPHGGLAPPACNPSEHGSPGHPRIAWLVWLAPLGTTQPIIHHPLTRKSRRRKYAAMRVSGWQTDPEAARQPALGGSVYRWEASTAGGPPSPDPGPCLVLFVYLERQLWLGAYTPTPQSPLARTPPKWECALALGFGGYASAPLFDFVGLTGETPPNVSPIRDYLFCLYSHAHLGGCPPDAHTG